MELVHQKILKDGAYSTNEEDCESSTTCVSHEKWRKETIRETYSHMCGS